MELPKVKEKTPSQRLRAVISVYGKLLGVNEEGLDDFYTIQVEGLIKRYREAIKKVENKAKK